MFTESHINALKSGKIAVLPTDTLYGLVGSARLKSAYDALINIRGIKESQRRFVILISKIEDMTQFGVELNDLQRAVCGKLWPGPFSIELGIGADLSSIVGFDTSAFRIPKDDDLRKFLEETGPLFAPSANPTGMPPARNIDEAKAYFGDKVDLYIDGGNKSQVRASTLLRVHNNSDIEVLRMGDIDPKTLL